MIRLGWEVDGVAQITLDRPARRNALDLQAFSPAIQLALQGLAVAPLLVVAAIDGVCMGGGMQLAVAADVRVVTPDARLSVPAARLGLAIDGWTASRLAAAAGAGEASALLLTAAEIDGTRAHGHRPGPAAEDARIAAWRSADLQEGRAAFAEKRPPRFTGR